MPESSSPMSEADREIQAAARAFVDELIPHEVEAELHDGELSAELLKRHRRRVHELSSTPSTCPRSSVAAASRRSSRCWCRSRSAAPPTPSVG